MTVEPDLTAGPMTMLSGPAMGPQDPVLTLQGQVDDGEVLVGVAPVLAPRHAQRLIELAEAKAFEGQMLDVSQPHLVVLGADAAKLKGKAAVQGEKSRVAPGPGLLYFDGESKLAILTGDAKLDPRWVCVGQVKVQGPVVKGWREKKPTSLKMVYFGNLRG